MSIFQSKLVQDILETGKLPVLEVELSSTAVAQIVMAFVLAAIIIILFYRITA